MQDIPCSFRHNRVSRGQPCETVDEFGRGGGQKCCFEFNVNSFSRKNEYTEDDYHHEFGNGEEIEAHVEKQTFSFHSNKA